MKNIKDMVITTRELEIYTDNNINMMSRYRQLLELKNPYHVSA